MTALTQGWRSFATTTTRLGGGDQQLRVRDCGKDEEVVKHTLHLDMAARPGQQYMLCSHGGGVCQGWLPQKPRERRPLQTPRRAATTTAASNNPSRATKASRDTNRAKDAVPYRGGLHLLFEPEAMDKWIPRKIATNEGGAYVNNETGRTVDYERYMQRLSDRFRTGEQADRLVHIVVHAEDRR